MNSTTTLINDPNEQVSKAIDYLKTFDDAKTLIDDKQAHEQFLTLNKLANEASETILNKHCEKLLGNTLLELYITSSSIDFRLKPNPTITSDQINKNSQQARLIPCILSLVNTLVLKSANFSIQFASSNGLRATLSFLKDDIFLAKILRVRLKKLDMDFVDYLVLTLNNLSAEYEQNADVWQELDVAECLLKVVALKPSVQLRAHVILCDILSDKQLESNLAETMTNVASELIGIVATCANDFRRDDFSKRVIKRVVLDDDTLRQDDTRFGTIEAYGFRLRDGSTATIRYILKALYKLSVNDKMRAHIYENARDHLKVIVSKGNGCEKKSALELLCQLSFNRAIAKDINGDGEFEACLMKSGEVEDDDEELKGIKNTLWWNLRKKETHVVTPRRKMLPTNLGGDIVVDDGFVDGLGFENKVDIGEHIMISYNSGSRELCLKVKSDLEAMGYKVIYYLKY